MRINEIQQLDDTAWIMAGNGKSFHEDFENLKKRHALLSQEYDKSTDRGEINSKIDATAGMVKEIRKMHTFCKNSSQDTETEELLKSLRLMYDDCKLMTEELRKYL